jgi:NitT/TauT family transport system ATP-binding protein
MRRGRTRSPEEVGGARPAQDLPISIERVSHFFERNGKRVDALRDVNLTVPDGEFLAILGPSGCGKSTLLLLVAGLLKPSLGAIRIGNTTITKPFTNLGIVFQDASLLEWRTALRNILLQAEVRKMDKTVARQRALALMRSAGLEGFEDSYPAELSGGMRQRVAICRALLHDPPLLLMDEPFGALDALTREQMVLDLQALWLRDQKTVLFVTHDISEAVFLADRVVVFSARPGRILDVVEVEIPRPRRSETRVQPRFVELEGKVRTLLQEHGVLLEEGPSHP